MTVFIFIAILIVLVLVHELGHFFAAKLFGVKVEEFGIGFPPRALSAKRGETVYSLNWLPLGGFVKIFGEEGQGVNNPASYAARPLWQRAIILVSGVTGNVLLTIVVLWIGLVVGFPMAIPEEGAEGRVKERHVQIVEVAPQSPADQAGIKPADIVVSARSETSGEVAIDAISALQTFTKDNEGEFLTLTIKRQDQLLEKGVLSRSTPPEGEGPLGIALSEVGIVSFPWYEALPKALTITWQSIQLIFLGIYLLLASLVTTGEVIGEVAGPVGIAVLAGQFYALGISHLLAFIALISINLAVLNILPIPALDGGRLFLLLIEKLKGSPLRPELEHKIHTVGFALLLGLLAFVTIQDILRL